MPIPIGVLAQAGAGGGAAGGPAYDFLEATEISTAITGSVNFTSLGSYSDYKHLQLRMLLRPRRIGFTYSGMYFRFNSDSTSSYAFHNLYGEAGGSAFSNATINSSAITPSFLGMGNNGTADIFTPMIVDIFDFASSSKKTTIRLTTGLRESSLSQVGLTSGLYNKTDAITSINIFGDEGWQVGSRFSLFGVK